MTEHDFNGLLIIAGIIIPAILFVVIIQKDLNKTPR